MSEQHAEREQRVTPLELFFDLVFVFAFTQVTTVLSDDPTWGGLGHGLLILAALWWAWAAYAWLTNTVDPDEGAVWGAMLDRERHPSRSVCARSTRPTETCWAAIMRIAPSAVAGAALIVGAGFVHGALRPMLRLAALTVGLFGPLLGCMSGWRVQPAHFIVRHGLIVIIAIGESLIAIGLGARSTELGTGVIVAAVLGLVVASRSPLPERQVCLARLQPGLRQAKGQA